MSRWSCHAKMRLSVPSTARARPCNFDAVGHLVSIAGRRKTVDEHALRDGALTARGRSQQRVLRN